MSEQRGGWWWPVNSQKAHYIVNGYSLCRRWMSFASGETFEQGNDNSRDNCVTCKKKLAAIAKARGVSGSFTGGQ